MRADVQHQVPPTSVQDKKVPSTNAAFRHATMLLTCVIANACASAGPSVPPAPQPPPAVVQPVRTGLPPVPSVDGALVLDVVYPAEGDRVAVRDSTFVFGSAGSG